MLGECLVVALILAILIFGFFRAKRKNWGFAVLPLTTVPVSVCVVMYVVKDILKLEYSYMLPLSVIVASLAVTCIWIGICSVVLIKTKKMRVPYVGTTVAFSLAFSFLLLIQYQAELGI